MTGGWGLVADSRQLIVGEKSKQPAQLTHNESAKKTGHFNLCAFTRITGDWRGTHGNRNRKTPKGKVVH